MQVEFDFFPVRSYLTESQGMPHKFRKKNQWEIQFPIIIPTTVAHI